MKLDLLSRSQLQEIHQLGGNRNASRVMKQLEPYVSVIRRADDSIYFLNKAGRERVGSENVITKSTPYHHTLLRNDVYCYYKPRMWKNEYEIKVRDFHIRSDAVFMIKDKHFLLEVDNEQKMSVNKEKLNEYFRFMNADIWQKSNKGTFPTILFYVLSDYRKAKLLEYNPGIPLTVLTKKDLK